VTDVPRLGIAKDFLADYATLQKPVRKAVDGAIEKFAAHTYAGLHLEKLANAKDPRIRTIRITQFYRGVVLAPDDGEEYLLLTVRPHDDAIAFAASRRFTVNHALGVLEVRNQKGLDEATPRLREEVAASRPLFARVKDGELRRLGIDPDLLPVVRLLATDAHLDALRPLLPEAQYDALAGLAAGLSPEQVWAEICQRLPDGVAPVTVDTADVSAAAARTPDRFRFVSGPEEMAAILSHPFDAWRVFLHPSQHDVAYRPSYHGPVLVTGGAGTGKTVTALHRAVFLADRADGAEPAVLVTTFTRTLADALDRQVRLLAAGPTTLARLEILNVDRLAYRVVARSLGHNPTIADPQRLREVWQRAADGAPAATGIFLQREWEQVVLAQGITTLAGYLAARRHGRGRPLQTPQRTRVWAAIQKATDDLRDAGQWTHLQLAHEAARLLATAGDAPYRHVVVDEGQDLHPAQWRLLRAAVRPGPDDLFIVADPFQRIYDNRVSLSSLRIGIRGRTRRLTLNYRTTEEILSWAVRLLRGVTPTGLDDAPDTLRGYHSPVHGAGPILMACPDRRAENDRLAERVRSWLDAGIEPHSIGVAARSGHLAREVRETIAAAGIPASTPQAVKTDAVRVGTMHAMKGLEFRCVAVVGVDAEAVPARGAVTPEEEDPLSHDLDLARERCLLFVACTRARDGLYVSYVGAPSPFLGEVNP
jgi:hypothetical protein